MCFFPFTIPRRSSCRVFVLRAAVMNVRLVVLDLVRGNRGFHTFSAIAASSAGMTRHISESDGVTRICRSHSTATYSTRQGNYLIGSRILGFCDDPAPRCPTEVDIQVNSASMTMDNDWNSSNNSYQ
jgi:hypothetical protein